MDPNFWFDKSDSILVVIPMEATFIETGQSSGKTYASVQMLDVLKGPTPTSLPTMVSFRDDHVTSSCGEWSFTLGATYILYLDRVNQETYTGSVCGPNENFRHARYQQELYCFDGNPRKDRFCSTKLLKRLRRANAANGRHYFNEQWWQETKNEIANRVRRLRAQADLGHSQ